MKYIYIPVLLVFLMLSCGPKTPEIKWESGLVGNRAPESLEYYFDLQKDTIAKLYKNSLYLNPDINGSFMLHFFVMKDGRVESVNLDDCTLKDSTLLSLIRLAVAEWTFPISEIDSVEILVPFYLLQEE
ncbi:AgmX/PglI C-terminal domain-containing protein [candidate division WOR-3 bacterium]|nr:AgmX/PglI C-terminal domain-containing protein [candidate division WOR-3 bacterium]